MFSSENLPGEKKTKKQTKSEREAFFFVKTEIIIQYFLILLVATLSSRILRTIYSVSFHVYLALDAGSDDLHCSNCGYIGTNYRIGSVIYLPTVKFWCFKTKTHLQYCKYLLIFIICSHEKFALEGCFLPSFQLGDLRFQLRVYVDLV